MHQEPCIERNLIRVSYRSSHCKYVRKKCSKLPILAYTLYLGLNCTSCKLFEFVTGNIARPAFIKIQKRKILNASRSNPFIYYIKQMVKESIIRFIKELINVVQ